MEAIAHIKWDSDVPLELLQARKAFELATKQDAEAHTPEIYADAESALIKSNEIAMDAPRSRQLLDVARRAVTLSNEALNISTHRIEAIALEEDNARRRAETEALEQRATEAEVTAREAAELAERARADAERTRIEKERMVAETAALESEKGELESTMTLLREERLGLIAESERLHQEKVDLEMESERLLREKSELHARLESALSHVAETQESAHGFVVNLPDILFDLNEATLKTEAQLVLAKLAGIMLIMPDQGAVIEGHTDSTGSPDYNLDLSQRRARAVLDFMQGEGLAPTRLRAIGKGMESPVADNSSPEGRKRNRRVEIEITAEDVDHLASN
jgi:outer membrane protein OmpA-like peptidoglycan-associated protein